MQGIFIGTFLIGLREGLEATLIVSVIGAFLTRNGKSVRPMVLGVGLAVVISIAVGAGLDVLSASLPQRQQEMLETVIGAIAVVFVTTMVIWMNRNAFRMKGQLEREAAQAINSGGVTALALMAFLAVLKEGFETAVFLLAAAQTAQGSRWFALFGGVAGIATAVAIGAGIYVGSLRLDLGRFFRITGVFLVFIAAGLVMSSLRTAHEAGWVDVGQSRIVDLSAVLGPKSVAGAVVTGMFGIPPDPRLIEVLGWLLYAVPVLVVFLWPARWVPAPASKRRLTFGVAVVLAVLAGAMAVLIPAGGSPAPGPTRTARTAGGGTVTATVHADGAGRVLTVVDPAGPGQQISLAPAGQQSVDGADVDVWQARVPADPGVTTSPIGLAQLTTLTGGRLPVGLGTARTPGPFDATWSASTVYTVLAHGDDVVSAERASSRVATLSGGGLTGPKTVSVGGLAADWATNPDDDQTVTDTMAQSNRDRAERTLWTVWLPTVFAVAAVLVALTAARTHSNTDERERRQHGESPTRDEIGVA
ncbi:high-affinity Fe2+/Pb2+ permease [Mycobacterium sp. Root135]|uniref:iron uptake transporter permease EfeU n=1 Tax=Mycobacterium sp. Root135 TaxID=1736457 RepID=UPI0006F253C7|nr:iron uptake transporter permease EfeU [Mycobacterium sp. Root135]KQY07043.1 high-affinity Fe2+/Pb2+ permease [Mycobacterium sp. Root135]